MKGWTSEAFLCKNILKYLQKKENNRVAKLATELPKSEFGAPPHKGPVGIACLTYADCDLDDFQSVKALKDSGLTWDQIQEQVDRILGITDTVPKIKFIYHWRGDCACWRGRV